MQEFVLITPEGWTEIPFEVFNQVPGSSAAIDNYISSNAYPALTDQLIEINAIPQGSNIVEASLFNGEILVVKFG